MQLHNYLNCGGRLSGNSCKGTLHILQSVDPLKVCLGTRIWRQIDVQVLRPSQQNVQVRISNGEATANQEGLVADQVVLQVGEFLGSQTTEVRLDILSYGRIELGSKSRLNLRCNVAQHVLQHNTLLSTCTRCNRTRRLSHNKTALH